MDKSTKDAIAAKKSPRATKGAPSGLVISLIVHGIALFVAGLIGVFTILPSPKLIVTPPPAYVRPIMKLIKPKVKINRSSLPRPSARIIAQVPKARLPEIQIPDNMDGGEGLLDGLVDGAGGFLGPPDLGEIDNPIGLRETLGHDMRVSYYNLNLLRSGNAGSMSPGDYEAVIEKFIRSGFNKSVLAKYYRSPRTLYATTVMIPLTLSTVAPAAFEEDLKYSYCWAALYEGTLVHKDGITFRFWGASDDVLAVQVDGELVLNASFYADGTNPYAPEWSSSAPYSQQLLGNQYRRGSDWITLEPGVPLDLKVILGESPGGEFSAQLLVEVEGMEYSLNDQGAKIFEVFAVEPLSWELQDTIMLTLCEGEANVTNVTTIFRDY